MTIALDNIPQLATRFETEPPEALLEFAYSQFDERMALACSFGAEDVVLAEMAARVHPGARVFYLDTDFLFSETHTVRERIAAQYPLKIEACRPALTPEEQASRFGEALWTRQPNQCCGHTQSRAANSSPLQAVGLDYRRPPRPGSHAREHAQGGVG